ncbi:cytochrome P450 [Mangrovicoccus algicola]|uniref:Cytochrome P450 n=1 Tax=Mangrovicoccus algicola TaxID=2771008 RepID=A0A8J6Z0E7_9RHOB|nr:cytochrome P450 [Mangrovicoccus algicola]MBE3639263.1 cytochrome P450 [Mangrovicoccus algicola]
MPLAPSNAEVSFDQLTLDPYPVYRRMRAETPVVRVESVKRTFLTKAAHTRLVKDNPELFSSNDPNTPMQPAFRAHTLMRKDGAAHRRERMAMQPSFTPKVIKSNWAEKYEAIAKDYIARLPQDGGVDLYRDLCGPVAARILAVILGIEDATDEQMMRWSQNLIDGAGNFAWRPGPFEVTDRANDEMNALFDRIAQRHLADPGPSAFSVMLNAKDPIPREQIYANLKIAIGGGINEPRDALATIVYGLLRDPGQFEEVRRQEAWDAAFEEGVRWVAPIQASSRLVLEDCQIGGWDIPKGDTVMTIQASSNRDEDVYENGEDFIVFRPSNPHQAFGSGPHHCAGANIARRTVGQIMLPLLFDAFPRMSLPDAEAVQWRGFGFRGPINLPVRLN